MLNFTSIIKEHLNKMERDMEWLSIVDVITTMLEVIGGSAVIATIFPNADQSKINVGLSVIRKVVDILGFNFGNAKNKY